MPWWIDWTCNLQVSSSEGHGREKKKQLKLSTSRSDMSDRRFKSYKSLVTSWRLFQQKRTSIRLYVKRLIWWIPHICLSGTFRKRMEGNQVAHGPCLVALGTSGTNYHHRPINGSLPDRLSMIHASSRSGQSAYQHWCLREIEPKWEKEPFGRFFAVELKRISCNRIRPCDFCTSETSCMGQGRICSHIK